MAWFKEFELVFNALDNLEARRHVNKMCLAADVPLVESGTTGFNGQVQVIRKVRYPYFQYLQIVLTLGSLGTNRVLRLCPQRGTEELPRLHHSKYSKPANPLHCMGQELPLY